MRETPGFSESGGVTLHFAKEGERGKEEEKGQVSRGARMSTLKKAMTSRTTSVVGAPKRAQDVLKAPARPPSGSCIEEWSSYHAYASTYWKGKVMDHERDPSRETFRTAKEASTAKLTAALHDLVAAFIDNKFAGCPQREKHPHLHDVWQVCAPLLP